MTCTVLMCSVSVTLEAKTIADMPGYSHNNGPCWVAANLEVLLIYSVFPFCYGASTHCQNLNIRSHKLRLEIKLYVMVDYIVIGQCSQGLLSCPVCRVSESIRISVNCIVSRYRWRLYRRTPTNAHMLTALGLPWRSPIQVLTEVDVAN